MYCDCDHFEGNVGIQNIFTRTRYQEVLQKFHFAKNTKQDKTDKGYKFKPIIYHLNELFQTVFSNEPDRAGKIRHTVVSCAYRVPEVVLRRTKYRVPKVFISSYLCLRCKFRS